MGVTDGDGLSLSMTPSEEEGIVTASLVGSRLNLRDLDEQGALETPERLQQER